MPALLLGAVVLLRPTPTSVHAAAGPLPEGMPSHFSFGVMDSPGGQTYLNGMRSTNGTAWDYRYQYLSGGAGTGWSTWNSPAGEFANYYMQDSGNNGYMPAFVYYQMLQSSGPSGSGEGSTDLAHLASSSTMSAYYADWTLLMQKVGAYGKPALVVVEPDLWGFMQQAAGSSNSAASIPASVASSGNTDAAGLPNTAQGYAWALLRIRDHYAKNATLALHASGWGTGTDIGSNSSPNIDAVAIGTQTAQFMKTAGISGNPAGISSFDVISNDIADHDSGQSGNWWDRYNTTFPNFTRYLQYVNALSNGTGRRVVMWQVPIGNQYFGTQNNTQGHTQDNKAEYILGHIADFANAGVVGVLFGPGNGGTYAQDARNDGVTNAAPISTYECNGCNTHTSTYADDDGGYLRIFVGQYYKSGGYALGGTTPPPPPSPTPTGTPTSTATPTPTGTPTPPPVTCTPTIAFGAGSATPSSVTAGSNVALGIQFTASCATSAIVDFEVYNAAGAKTFQKALSNQTLTGNSQTVSTTWAVPSGQASGTYTLRVGVFSNNWGTTYGWDGNAANVTVAAAAAACTGNPAITFNGGSTVPSAPARGTTAKLNVTLTASCATQGLIDFEVYDAAGAQVFQSALDNQQLTGSAQTFSTSWNIPSSQSAGTYTVKVGVFSPGWGTFYAWNNDAATLNVQ